MSTNGSNCVLNQRVDLADGHSLVADCYSGSAPAIVFIHGWSQSRVVWQEQVRALAGKRMVVTYDLRGHGDSTRPSDASSYLGDWTPGEDLESVLTQFSVDEALLVGWSFGSVVAANSAVYLGPERIRGVVLVSGTVESGTVRNTENFGPLFKKVAAMTDAASSGDEREAVHRFLRESYLLGDWSPSLYDSVYAANMRLTPAERSIVAQRPRQEFASDINRLKIPMLLIHGAKDPVFSVASSMQAHADLLESSILVYPETGHWPFLEQADRFNDDVEDFFNSIAE